MLLSNWYHPPRGEHLWIDREECPRRWEGQGRPYTMGRRGTMYPALSSVHTNTLNFVHILIQAFFVFLLNLFVFIFCILQNNVSCPFIYPYIELYIIYSDWNKESWLRLILISTLSPSIGPFYEHCKRGGRGHIVPPSIGYSISQYDYRALRKPRGGREREVTDVAVKDSCYV